MATSIDHKLGHKTAAAASHPASKKRRLPRYEFRKWHAFAVVGCIVLVVAANFTITTIAQAQQRERERKAAEQQKVEAAAAAKRQKCYRAVVSDKADQVGKLTYDELYADKCS